MPDTDNQVDTAKCSGPDADNCVCLDTDPGICGFPCTIKACKTDARTVAVEISGSECKQIKRLERQFTEMSLNELFLPLTRNPIYQAAEKSGCHPSCAIPCAVLKAVEAAMGMALPKEVRITFTS